jgi:hypothetical protein
VELFKEFAPKVNARAGIMFPVEDIVGRVGFSTVYAFDRPAADEIKARRSSKGMSAYPVYADSFTVDFDNGLEDAKLLRDWAKSQGFSYEMWESGGKGAHVVIPHAPLFSTEVPFTHGKLADKLAPSCDRSLYRHGSLLRLPGTLHQTTGRPKVLLECGEGEFEMTVPLMTRSSEKFAITPLETPQDELQFWLHDIARFLGACPGRGNRFMTLWRLARFASECGLSAQVAYEMLQAINSSWGEDAHDLPQVTKAVEQGFK